MKVHEAVRDTGDTILYAYQRCYATSCPLLLAHLSASILNVNATELVNKQASSSTTKFSQRFKPNNQTSQQINLLVLKIKAMFGAVMALGYIDDETLLSYFSSWQGILHLHSASTVPFFLKTSNNITTMQSYKDNCTVLNA